MYWVVVLVAAVMDFFVVVVGALVAVHTMVAAVDDLRT